MSDPPRPAPTLDRAAGPLAIAAGALMVVAQLTMWPFDETAHVAMTRNGVFQVAGAVYFLGFCVLLFALIAAYRWEEERAGRLGLAGMVGAAVGTMALGGDLWFESFAVPWIADEVPQAFETEPTTVLALGAIASYLLFAGGWALFGVASLQAGVFPKAISVAIIVSGLLGFSALLPPFGVPLGLTMFALGVWMIRSPRTSLAAAPM